MDGRATKSLPIQRFMNKKKRSSNVRIYMKLELRERRRGREAMKIINNRFSGRVFDSFAAGPSFASLAPFPGFIKFSTSLYFVSPFTALPPVPSLLSHSVVLISRSHTVDPAILSPPPRSLYFSPRRFFLTVYRFGFSKLIITRVRICATVSGFTPKR